ncbi:hypothetical protein OOT33_10185 [Sphingobium sp. DEHP117]|uniref:hypothetical protein n=1 Tax=Sphingobium sp. DEHP117 TaxID=2993436 RepID=UPI0027D54B9A|nr:hypothetical protein [Sphingobium sp. DEHP117]MDQ4420796.1 hypothetical protein [Sphingobium sp. DEHP117]
MAAPPLLALTGGFAPALARPVADGPDLRPTHVPKLPDSIGGLPQRPSAAFPIAGVVKRNGAYYLDLDLRPLEREGFDTYATVGGGKAGFARLEVGVVTSASLSGPVLDGWSLFGMTGYGHRADPSALRNLETGNQWVGGVGLGYRF